MGDDIEPDPNCRYCEGTGTIHNTVDLGQPSEAPCGCEAPKPPVLTPSTCIPEPPFPDRAARYAEKVEAKRERYAERSQKARGESRAAFESARVIADGIPMGQPILVGHHSEKRHRRDIERIDRGMRKGIEAENKAAYYDHKAKSYGTHGVSSDDPSAIEKLTIQLVARRRDREAEKFWNKELARNAKRREKELGRALTQSDHVSLVEGLLCPDPLKRQLMSYARAFPWLPKFGNHTQADIKRIEGRIAELKKVEAMGEREVRGTGYSVEWNKLDNRVQIYFVDRPSDATIAKLKSHGFRWARSIAAWQRHASEGAWYHAMQIVGHKEEVAHADASNP